MSNIFDLFKKIETPSVGPITHIVVGLGNPGKEYDGTRHNAGFILLDAIAAKHNARIDRARFRALTGEAQIGEKRALLMKPQTFMNLSGEAVGEAVRFYKLAPEKVIVLSDDISLDCGRLRVRRKGSAGGHNGLKSINEHLGTDAYPRVKIGVGQKPHPDYELADWVLANLPAEDQKKMSDSFDILCNGVEKLIAGDIDGAMQICNGSGK
jgi:PTH1 family peptidyl-tRNA hydrolase